MVAMNDDHMSGLFAMDDCSDSLKREVPKAIQIIYHIYIKDPDDPHMIPSQPGHQTLMTIKRQTKLILPMA